MPLVDVQAGLRTFLLEDVQIASAVGGSRIHYIRLPNAVIPGPSVVINRISEVTDYLSKGPSGLVTTRFQIDAWAVNYGAAEDLAIKIKDRMSGYRGLMGAVNVQAALSGNANPEYDSGVNLYRASRDFMVSYDERA